MKKLKQFLIWLSFVLCPCAHATGNELTAVLGTGLTASSNPAPASLTTASPYPTPFVNQQTVSAAWVSQGSKCLILVPFYNTFQLPEALKLHFVPSVANATFTVTTWMYDRMAGTWGKPYNTPSVNYTGDQIDYILRPGWDPIFLQLSNISSGTLSIYFDPTVANAL